MGGYNMVGEFIPLHIPPKTLECDHTLWMASDKKNPETALLMGFPGCIGLLWTGI
jgi:hypothetical protein